MTKLTFVKTIQRPRRGLTLIELLIAIAIMSMMAAALGTLSHAVQMSSAYTGGRVTTAQHGRVSLDRICNAVNGAYANETFPGAAVFATTVGSYSFPDTLVVWTPATNPPTNPAGLPLFSEITVYCPSSSAPNQLLEITSPTDTRSVPSLSNMSTWQTELSNLRTSATSQKTLLTDLIRTASTSSSSGGASLRGAVRFVLERHPTATEWASYRAGTTGWTNVLWPQGMYGSQAGLSQTWVRTELQFKPSYVTSDSTGQLSLPFFGSAATYFQLTQ